jgi:Zn-finger nucleic acid-binding protein
MLIASVKCPACFNELTKKQVGNVEVDVCQGGCGGIWFDAFELQRVDEAEERAGEHLLEIERDESIVVDSSRKRQCPRCEGVKLMRHFFSARRRIEVDQCPSCNGYWLDAGELAAVRAEMAQEERLEEGARSRVSAETIRYLYRLQVGSRRPQ